MRLRFHASRKEMTATRAQTCRFWETELRLWFWREKKKTRAQRRSTTPVRKQTDPAGWLIDDLELARRHYCHVPDLDPPPVTAEGVAPASAAVRTMNASQPAFCHQQCSTRRACSRRTTERRGQDGSHVIGPWYCGKQGSNVFPYSLVPQLIQVYWQEARRWL